MSPTQTTAGPALLSYRLMPPQVYAGSTVDLVVQISNPTGSAVTFGPRDEIQIWFPSPGGADPLTNTLPASCRSSSRAFSCASGGGGTFYSVTPFSLSGTTLQATDGFSITFPGVVIDSATGSASLTFKEFIGGSQGQTSLQVTKLPLALSVVAWLEDLVVGMDQTTTLRWQSAANIGVSVSGFADDTNDTGCPPGLQRPGYRCFPVSGMPPYTGSTEVGVDSDTVPQRTYTVTAYTSDGKQVDADVTLTQHSPVIAGFGAAPDYAVPAGPLAAGAKVPLAWKIFYAASATLTNPAGKIISRVANPAAPLVVSPAMDAAAAGGSTFASIPATATYTLTATGFGRRQQATVELPLQPPRLLYFKFLQNDGGTLSQVAYALDPPEWPAANLQLGPPAQLTVHEPGGTARTYYLGEGDTTHPQVQFFAATPGQGKEQTLSWVTANAQTLVLEPGGYQVPADQVANGSYVVTPDSATDYVLAATAASGETVSSTLTVSPG
jgi:hypothetical protein